MKQRRAVRTTDIGSRGPTVKRLQRQLRDKGLDPGPIDGRFGARTGQAVRRFRRAQNMKSLTKAGPTVVRRLGMVWDPLPKPGKLSGTPKRIVNRLVLESQRRGFPHMTLKRVFEANERHGPTVSGNRSDHQGPGNEAWAADISNGSNPTPEMDRFAKYLARKLGGHWSGSGAVSWVAEGYRMQLIYRSNVGGNHYNHIHIGIRKL